MVSRTQDTMVSTKFNIKPFPIRQSSQNFAILIFCLLLLLNFILQASPSLSSTTCTLSLLYLSIYVSTPLHDFRHLCHPLLFKLSPFTHIFHFFLFFLFLLHFFLYHFFLFNFPRYIQLFATRETPPPWTSRPFE